MNRDGVGGQPPNRRLKPTKEEQVLVIVVPRRALEQQGQVIDQLHVDGDGAAHGGIAEDLGDSLPMHLAHDLPAELRQVVLGVGVLDVGEEIGSPAHEVGAPAQEIPSA